MVDKIRYHTGPSLLRQTLIVWARGEGVSHRPLVASVRLTVRAIGAIPLLLSVIPVFVVLTTKGQKPPQPGRKGFATTTAKGPSFFQLSYVKGLGFLGEKDEQSYAPFTGPDAADKKHTYRKYQISAQGCIQRALDEPLIAQALTTNVGTAPELVVLGDALLRGMVLTRTLFFQSKTFKDPVFNPSGRIFNVDILKAPFGDSWLEPVDGIHFHMANLEQELRDADRNNELAQYGHVLAITDQVCFSREALRAFLDARGSP